MFKSWIALQSCRIWGKRARHLYPCYHQSSDVDFWRGARLYANSLQLSHCQKRVDSWRLSAGTIPVPGVVVLQEKLTTSFIWPPHLQLSEHHWFCWVGSQVAEWSSSLWLCFGSHCWAAVTSKGVIAEVRIPGFLSIPWTESLRIVDCHSLY